MQRQVQEDTRTVAIFFRGILVRLRAAYGGSRYPGGMVLRHKGTRISSLLHIHRTLRYYMLAGSITGERGGDCGLSDSGEFVPALAAMASLHIPDVRICDLNIVRKMFSRLYALMGRLARSVRGYMRFGQICSRSYAAAGGKTRRYKICFGGFPHFSFLYLRVLPTESAEWVLKNGAGQ